MTNADEAAYGHGAVNGHCCGLTKREYFAVMAMQGLIASALPIPNITPENYTGIFDMAVKAADNLIKELNKSV